MSKKHSEVHRPGSGTDNRPRLRYSYNLTVSTLLIVCMLSLNTTLAQDTTYKTQKPVFAGASFLYDFPQSYGLTAAVNYPFRSIVKTRISKNGKPVTKQKDRFFGVEASAYRYPFNYTGILLVPFLGVRHYVRNSFFYEPLVGVGVLRTFYDGKVYEVDASGNIREKTLFGRFYATTHLSTAFNFLIQRPGNKIVTLQVKPSIWFQYPFDSFIKPHFSLEAGIEYEIAKRSIRTRQTIKHRRK